MPIGSQLRRACVRWQPWTTIIAVVLASLALTAWQFREFRHERELTRETLRRQADSVTDALIGGIHGHRNRGMFFADQLQGSLDGLVNSPDILAVAICSDDGQPLLGAGDIELLETLGPIWAGHVWGASAYRYTQLFELSPSQSGPHGGGPRGGPGGIRGGGPPSWARGGDLGGFDARDPRHPFAAEGDYFAVLVLDRSLADARCKRAFLLRVFVVLAGISLLVGGSLAWRVAVRAATRSRLLEAESRHLRELNQAAAGLAHETRNPLGLIRGWTQRLLQSGLPATDQQHAEAVVEECDRVTSRINQFLAFARPSDPTIESVDLNEVLDELVLLMEPDLEAKQITLSMTDVPPKTKVQADRELLRQALFNLIQNAVQASDQGGTVDIGVRQSHEGSRRIEVSDRGTGVAPEIVESLFTPYFTTRSSGTGLGLAIVRRIATAHEWEVGYTPRTSGGAIFWLDGIRSA